MKKDKFLNTDIVDFHSHILPCVDDGSKSFEQTTEMLYETSNQGIKSIVATPHFYASSDIPEKFFKRREAALTKLLDIYNSFSSIPDIYRNRGGLFSRHGKFLYNQRSLHCRDR